MAGSFFQFSAGGWSFLKGYKLWEGKEEESAGSILGIPVENLPFGNQKEDKKGPREDGLYVVSSVRAPRPNPNEVSALRTMQASLWDAENLLPDERRLCCERLNTLWNQADAEEDATTIVKNTAFLDEIYAVLEPMKLKVLPVPIVAMLAANLAPALAREGADTAALLAALKEGLGLSPPQDAFWKPLGTLTKSLIAEEKIWLLVDFVPFFASPEKKARLLLLPPILEQALATVTATVGDMEEADLQLLAVDLTTTDFLLKKDDTDGADFLKWLNALAPFQLRDILEERKKFDGSAGRSA